jgi:small conductance mechanosensitive channel
MEDYMDIIVEYALNYGTKFLGAIVVLIVGFWLIRLFSKVIIKALDKRNIDVSLKTFIKSLITTLLKILLIISVVGMLGVEMTSFIALLGAAGLAIGMALSGTLQNFAGGVVILFMKMYKVGDYIDSNGNQGTVKEIQIFNTILKTIDNKIVTLPNSSVISNSLINYTQEETRRVDWVFGIAYGDDTKKARDILIRLMDEDKRILKDPKAFVVLAELGDSSVNFSARAWVKTEDYWDVFFEMNQKVYDAFNNEGINIPFPQMDVHFHQNEKA